MATNELVKKMDSGVIEKVLLSGDLSELSPTARLDYYKKVCESLGLNPLTKPFQYIKLNNKLTLYAQRDATDQLRSIHKVSVEIIARELMADETYVVTAKAELPDDRVDSSIGAVSLKGISGQDRANAMMKAETKSKRRVTLSIIGLGWLDETEVETIADAKVVEVDMNSGEIKEAMAIPQSAEMTLDTAKATVSSDGTKYGDIPTDKLSIMANSLKKKLDKNDEPDQCEIRKFKLDAIICILKSRANDNPA
jgi:hypothetical protein